MTQAGERNVSVRKDRCGGVTVRHFGRIAGFATLVVLTGCKAKPPSTLDETESVESRVELRTGTRRSRLKDAIIASFSQPASSVAAQLAEFSIHDWRGILIWLDLSGLALYLLDRLIHLRLLSSLPAPIRERLEQNLADNRERASALFSETVAISKELHQARIPFAVLKGVTLCPELVSDITLRCQADIDILISETDAIAVRDILVGFGYRLNTIKGHEWSFTAGVSMPMKSTDIYRIRPQRQVELHLLSPAAPGCEAHQENLLARARPRLIQGAELPALSPPDMFIQLARHIFKHLCSEHTRAQWVLEFCRFIEMRKDDREFWRNVEMMAGPEPQAMLAIAATTHLAYSVFGLCAPEALTSWTSANLPLPVRLWIETYGRRVLLAQFPASKFYLFLRQQLEMNNSAQRVVVWHHLLPRHWWPVPVTSGKKDERLIDRISRYCLEARVALMRFRFHMRTGIPFVIESWRWQRIQGCTRLR